MPIPGPESAPEINHLAMLRRLLVLSHHNIGESPDRKSDPYPPGLISETTLEYEWHRPMPDRFPPGTAREVCTILFGSQLPEEIEPPSQRHRRRSGAASGPTRDVTNAVKK
jgi:hypothetical protein